MNFKIKTIDNNKNKCKVCSKEMCIGDIIKEINLFCHDCYKVISNITVDDVEYSYYKTRIKSWLLSKYNLNNMR